MEIYNILDRHQSPVTFRGLHCWSLSVQRVPKQSGSTFTCWAKYSTFSRTGTRTRSRTRAPNHEAGSGAAVARVHLHSAGDGLEGAVPEVVESLLVQVGLLLAQALLEQLAFVSELDHRLGVGVEGGDGGSHAAGEGTPRHAGWRGRHREGESDATTLPSSLSEDVNSADCF